MTDFAHAMLFLRMMMFFVVAYELFLISTLMTIPENHHAKFMRWSCLTLSMIFIVIGFRAVLTYIGRGTFPADVILTPLLLAGAVVLAASVYHLLRSVNLNSFRHQRV